MSARWQCLRCVAVISTVAFASGCRLADDGKPSSAASAPPPPAVTYEAREVSSGKRVKVISFGRVESKRSVMMLDYLTDLDIYDSAALEKEVEEIWVDVRKDIGADVNRVEIMPTEPAERRKNSPVQALSRAYVYDRCGEGWCKGSGFKRREQP